MRTPTSRRMRHRTTVITSVLALGVFLLTPPASAETRPPRVPEKAVEFKGHWYATFLPPDITWDEAADQCRKKGGHLACLETEEERLFVNELIADFPERRFWLGGYRDPAGWKWLTGSDVNSSLLVNPGSKATGQRLMIRIVSQGRNWRGLLQPQPASSPPVKLAFLCEWPGGEVALTYPDGMDTTAGKAAPSGGSKAAKAADQSTGLVVGNEHARVLELKKTQTGIKGLLVIHLGGSESAGGASQMNLIARAGSPDRPATVAFNQKVGDSMSTALGEVVKFIELRHDGWPRGRTIEIAFEDKYSGKDGPSAAVACALLLESAFAGTDLDPHFAVTGDLNADGSVQPIGGVAAKIRGATNRDCTHVALPKSNETALVDLILTDGLKPVADIQVFSIATFDEAIALASERRSVELEKALAEFAEIQAVYHRRPSAFAPSLSHPRMIEKLQAVLSAAPNHLSASIMLSYALGNAPETLSLPGSVAFIGNTAYRMVDVIDEKGRVIATTSFDDDQIADAMRELRRMRIRLDKRTWKWADDLVGFGTLLREWQNERPNSYSARQKLIDSINAAGDSVKDERERLMSDPSVVEELSF